MWLDRLAAQSNASPSPSPSQPASRPYSPLPRRSTSSAGPYITSHRPAVSNRGSTLSLVSNDSTNSLLPSSRKANGSGLKQSQTAYEGPDPVDILGRVLGTSTSESADDDGLVPSITVQDLELDSDFGGLSLRAFAEAEPLTVNHVNAQPPRPQTIEECKSPCKVILPRHCVAIPDEVTRRKGEIKI